MKKYLSTLIRILIVIFLLALLIVAAILKNNVEICEAFARGPARVFVGFMSNITKVIPISITELSFVILFFVIIFLLVMSVIFLVKKKFLASLHRLFEIIAVVLFTIDTYNYACEFNYSRNAMPLSYYEGKVNREEHVDIYNYFSNDLNNCVSSLKFKETGEVDIDLSLKEIVEEIKKAYEIIDDPYFSNFFGAVKPMASSFIYREFQITGVTYSPLAEANINMLNTKTNLPLTIAHELAHTKGVMREDEANKLAFYVCLNSDSAYLRFSAYASYFYQIENMASDDYLLEEERNSLLNIDAIFYKCRYYEWKYWQEHDLLGEIGDFFNDLYIKSSGVKEGTSSYTSGTAPEKDPLTNKFIANPYQKLFLEKYYRH